MPDNTIVFATYAEADYQLNGAGRLIDSLRTFGGALANTALWVYVPDNAQFKDDKLLPQLESKGAVIRNSHTPEDARWFFYGGKPFAAAQAEADADAEGDCDLLVFLDDDTIIIDEPTEFNLAPQHSLGYRPVMHNRSGSLYGTEPDEFWGRIFEKLSLSDDQMFEMTTPADRQKIRAYFQCGMIVTRPANGILRQWVKDFEVLYHDQPLADMCKADRTKRVFLHQTALISAILHKLTRDQLLDLGDRYNYPIFFEKQYGGVEVFDSIENAVTIRCVVSSENMGEDWHEKLAGPPEKIAWLREHL